MRVADHLAGKPPEIVALYRHVHSVVRRIGPVRVDPQGRGIAFQVRARSIGVTPRARWLDLTLWLKRAVTHPRVHRVEDYGALGRILHFRLRSEEDLDAGLLRLLEEVYAVGAQTAAPVRRRRKA